MKRGLKRVSVWVHVETTEVEESSPMKRGLKQERASTKRYSA